LQVQWPSRRRDARLFATELAGSADCFSSLTWQFFGRLLVKSSALHFAKNTLALQLPLKYARGLIDVVVANEETFLSCCSSSELSPSKEATANGRSRA
jgi:hypothetical protein